jgi:ankyrin repeat protein
LIDEGASLDSQDKRNMTALIYAVGLDRTEIARSLIAKGAKLDLQDKNSGRTALT